LSSDDKVFSLEDSSGSDIFSAAENSDLGELFNSDFGDGHFKGFGFNRRSNIQWIEDGMKKTTVVFNSKWSYKEYTRFSHSCRLF